jgi:hypothetical protein
MERVYAAKMTGRRIKKQVVRPYRRAGVFVAKEVRHTHVL